MPPKIENGISLNPSREFVFVPPSAEVQRHAAVVQRLEPKIGEMLKGEKYLQSRNRLWQPSDFLPDLGSGEGRDGLLVLQEGAKRLSIPTLVSVTGNTITEDAVSTYQTWNNRPVGTQDETGVEQHPLAVWSRKWTAEEYRHHILLNRYLLLSGRVDMKALDISSQSLIANGFDTKTRDDPYKFFIFTAIQERATWIAHRNTGELAREEGVEDLADICKAVSLDEKRHERFYAGVMGMIFEEDPGGARLALDELDKAGILMPAAYMTDGEEIAPPDKASKLYDQYVKVAQVAGVYTVGEFYEVMDHFLNEWKISGLELSGDTAEARDRILKKYEKKDPAKANEIINKRIKKSGVVYDFSWVREEAS